MRTEVFMQKVRFSVQNPLNLHHMALAAFWALPIGLGICLAALGLSIFSPSSAEAATSIVRQAGMVVAMFSVFCLFAVAAAAVHQSWTTDAPAPKALPAPALAVFSIAPDVLVWRKEDESGEQFSDRIVRSKMAANDVVWIVVAPLRSPVVTVIKDGGKTMQFTRGDEPFKDDLVHGEFLPDGYSCTEETPEGYARYLSWFSAHWRKYSAVAKHAETPGASTVIHLAKVSAVFLLLLLSGGMSAQKARQVDDALGTRIREIPRSGEVVEFAFKEGGREKTYIGHGDGVKEYTEILQSSGRGLKAYNDQGGTLLYVKKSGEVVAKGVAVGDVASRVRSVEEFTPSTTGDPVRPRALPGEETRPTSFYLPDSMQMAERLNRVKEDMTGWKADAWRVISPVWDFAMWVFSSIMVLLVCAIIVFRYIAQSAADESLVTIYGRVLVGRWIVAAQQNSAAATLFCTWVIFVVALINAFLWMVKAGLPLWLLIPVSFVIGWIAERVTDWIVPNIRVVGHSGERGINPY